MEYLIAFLVFFAIAAYAVYRRRLHSSSKTVIRRYRRMAKADGVRPAFDRLLDARVEQARMMGTEFDERHVPFVYEEAKMMAWR